MVLRSCGATTGGASNNVYTRWRTCWPAWKIGTGRGFVRLDSACRRIYTMYTAPCDLRHPPRQRRGPRSAEQSLVTQLVLSFIFSSPLNLPPSVRRGCWEKSREFQRALGTIAWTCSCIVVDSFCGWCNACRTTAKLPSRMWAKHNPVRARALVDLSRQTTMTPFCQKCPTLIQPRCSISGESSALTAQQQRAQVKLTEKEKSLRCDRNWSGQNLHLLHDLFIRTRLIYLWLSRLVPI